MSGREAQYFDAFDGKLTIIGLDRVVSVIYQFVTISNNEYLMCRPQRHTLGIVPLFAGVSR
jgi:hypothetical protein